MTLARMLLRRLDEKDQELAMVVNEYGFITGLITYEDLVEVVVGKIQRLPRSETPIHESRPQRNHRKRQARACELQSNLRCRIKKCVKHGDDRRMAYGKNRRHPKNRN